MNRSRVLKKLGHIDADGVVQLKGRAACLIDTGDELLVTELMFNGNSLFFSYCKSAKDLCYDLKTPFPNIYRYV